MLQRERSEEVRVMEGLEREGVGEGEMKFTLFFVSICPLSRENKHLLLSSRLGSEVKGGFSNFQSVRWFFPELRLNTTIILIILELIDYFKKKQLVGN